LESERIERTDLTQQEIDEQSYRLRVFVEIISEADLMLLKRLVKSRDERIDSETKTEPGR
jgi:hypothetical protein